LTRLASDRDRPAAASAAAVGAIAAAAVGRARPGSAGRIARRSDLATRAGSAWRDLAGGPDRGPICPAATPGAIAGRRLAAGVRGGDLPAELDPRTREPRHNPPNEGTGARSLDRGTLERVTLERVTSFEGHSIGVPRPGAGAGAGVCVSVATEPQGRAMDAAAAAGGSVGDVPRGPDVPRLDDLVGAGADAGQMCPGDGRSEEMRARAGGRRVGAGRAASELRNPQGRRVDGLGCAGGSLPDLPEQVAAGACCSGVEQGGVAGGGGGLI
jgi:hypothetical protein